MKIIDVVNDPWAIQPEKLVEICEIYTTHLRGEKIDIAAVEARLGRPLANEQREYEVIDGVALIALEGVMAKRANLFMRISGGVSTEIVGRQLRQALDDAEVHSIILMVDSPGGTVDGTQSLGDLVFGARGGQKPIVALAHGVMASAAYWVGSAAEKVYIADGTTAVGSIGVVATHVDVSKAEERMGYKTTEITAGKYKRIASEYAPLTDEGRATIQERVDYLYSLFVGAVANQRAVSVEKVLEDMADGRVFIGEQAIKAGLVDGVSTLDALVAKLNADRAGVARFRSATQLKGTAMPLTREQLEAEAPDLVKTIRAEGAAAECERIKAVQAQLLPGHEALVQTLMFDGKSTAGDTAIAITAAERQLRQKAAAEAASAAPGAVASSPLSDANAGAANAAAEAARLKALPVEERCKAEWDASADLRKEFSSLAAYTAAVRAEEAGLARIKKAS